MLYNILYIPGMNTIVLSRGLASLQLFSPILKTHNSPLVPSVSYYSLLVLHSDGEMKCRAYSCTRIEPELGIQNISASLRHTRWLVMYSFARLQAGVSLLYRSYWPLSSKRMRGGLKGGGMGRPKWLLIISPANFFMLTRWCGKNDKGPSSARNIA